MLVAGSCTSWGYAARAGREHEGSIRRVLSGVPNSPAFQIAPNTCKQRLTFRGLAPEKRRLACFFFQRPDPRARARAGVPRAMAFGRARADDEGNAKTTANGKRPLSTSEKDILAAMASDSESDDETARVLAREELAAVPPSTLSWGDEDDEDDATRAAKPRKQASSSKRGGWLARLNAAHEQKEASVRDCRARATRGERRGEATAKERRARRFRRRSADASKRTTKTGEPVSHAESGPRRTRPDPHRAESATSSVAVAATPRARRRARAPRRRALSPFVAAVYRDSNRLICGRPLAAQGRQEISATQSLVFARALAEEAAARLASVARGAADGAAAEPRRRGPPRRRRARRRRSRRRRGRRATRRRG